MNQPTEKLTKARILVLKGIMQDLKCVLAEYSENYPVDTIENEVEDAFVIFTKDFVMEYNATESIFIISFFVGTTAQRASEITKILMLVLECDELRAIEDCFYDNHTNTYFYGAAALEKKTQVINKQLGLQKCPICEVTYPKDLIEDSGFCHICNVEKDFISWN